MSPSLVLDEPNFTTSNLKKKSVSLVNLAQLESETSVDSRGETLSFTSRFKQMFRGMFKSNEMKVDHKRIFEKKVFATALAGLDMDETNPNVPVFVTRCIDLLEAEDKIQTAGIYRASGNKTMMDEVRKKINQGSSKNKRFECLKQQDVNNLTGLFKQFFRELEPPLVSEDVMQKCLDSVGSADQSRELRTHLQELPEPERSTLRYVMRHLVRYVDIT